MPRVKVGPASPDEGTLDIEIARLRGLDAGALRARWHTTFRRKAPPRLSRHLLFRVLAYRMQADHLGDLEPDTRRVLESSRSTADLRQLTTDLSRIAESGATRTPIPAQGGHQSGDCGQQVMAA